MATAPQAIESKRRGRPPKQNAQQSPLQPIPAIKRHRSTKPPAIKNSVIIQRAQGRPKSHIARDLGITHNTVNSIIKESQIDVLMESGEKSAFALMHKSLDVLDQRLSKCSESAATYLLSNTLFSERYSKKAAPPADVVVNLAIQNLIQASQSAIDTQATAEQQTSQVIDTHSDNK